ncbi:amidase [Legionella spiritensis]|uniref:amidase n=1 Tax=Legionella spiritensis TaxID=452 RepID=UPI000F6F7622|nr:amidase [Legionella spiritensis]VEG91469.1 amidase [Legionella spiritensis]
MRMEDYCQQDAHALAEWIRKKKWRAEDVLDCAVRRMRQVNPLLNAVVTDCSEWGYRQLAGMRGDEPFYGVPVLVKDLGFEMNGVPYTAGSRFYEGTVSHRNSDMITRLLSLGMVPFAKTNTPELGLSYVTESAYLGPARNPYDLSRTPGGSSGGSAAAVAAGIAPVATASDGGGSIRIPAACCGLFGFKPTPGLISCGPAVGEAWSGMVSIHVLTRSVRDSAGLFAYLSETGLAALDQCPNSRTIPALARHQGKSVIIPEGLFADVPVDKSYRTAVDVVCGHLENMGYTIKRQYLPLDLAAIDECVLTIIAANVAAELERQQEQTGRKPRKNELESATWELKRRGTSIRGSRLIAARNKLYQYMRPVHDMLQSTNFLLTPALAKPPLPIGSLTMKDGFESFLQKNRDFSPFTSLFNQAGLPAMVLPVMADQLLPVGVQLAAGKWQDLLLLELAEQLQRVLPDFTRPVMTLHQTDF